MIGRLKLRVVNGCQISVHEDEVKWNSTVSREIIRQGLVGELLKYGMVLLLGKLFKI